MRRGEERRRPSCNVLCALCCVLWRVVAEARTPKSRTSHSTPILSLAVLVTFRRMRNFVRNSIDVNADGEQAKNGYVINLDLQVYRCVSHDDCVVIMLLLPFHCWHGVRIRNGRENGKADSALV